MSLAPGDSTRLLQRALETGRIHSGYLLSGDAALAREAAERFARALVCQAPGADTGAGPGAPCERCPDCSRSAHASASSSGDGDGPIEIDGTGKRGPLYRHIGDHPDLYWVDRGGEGTRVRIGQVRALQKALRLGANEGGRCAAVIADAEWLNVEAQNALLRLLEEPPPRTTLVLVTASAAGLLATIRSRCQRVRLPVALRAALRGEDAQEEVRALCARLDAIEQLGVPELLDWAEEFRGERARAADAVQALLGTASEWLRERTVDGARAGAVQLEGKLGAFRVLQACRKDLAQRNANPQMVAERALLALRGATA